MEVVSKQLLYLVFLCIYYCRGEIVECNLEQLKWQFTPGVQTLQKDN